MDVIFFCVYDCTIDDFFLEFFMHDFAFTAYFFRFNAATVLSSAVVHICPNNEHEKSVIFSLSLARLSNRTYESSSICVFVAMYTFSLHKSTIFRITASANLHVFIHPKMQCNAMRCMFFFVRPKH